MKTYSTAFELSAECGIVGDIAVQFEKVKTFWEARQ